jgi:repressor LexA
MLTSRQQEILDFIRDFQFEQGCSPSIPELQRAFGIKSPNGVASHLKALEAKGAIRRAERGSRKVELLGVPLLGSIVAGNPESREGCTSVDVETLGISVPRGCYALKVRGESMRDAGILDGDIVVLQPTPSPKAGQIVAALIDGDSTLKRLVTLKGKWYLKAENSAFPELIPRSDLVIQGVARTIIRNLV